MMRTRTLKPLVGALIVGSFAASCLDVGEDRARADLEVGRGAAGDVKVRVVDGLATIRSASDSELRLWNSAPTVAIELTGETSRTLELTLDNAMPAGQLSGEPASAVTVTALAAERPTQKRYSVELTGAGPATLRFATVSALDRTAFRFAVLSDVQEAIDDVRDIYTKVNDEGVEFLLGAGDLTQQGTVEQLERYQAELRSLNVPYYTTLGNHELGQNPTLWHDYFGRGNFSFEYHAVRFTMLDSASATIDPMVYGWLEGWLESSQDGTHVVAMHIPPTDPIGVRNGSFGSRAEAAKLLRRLAAGGVDLTLYGHIHSYYEFDNGGVPAYISGGGGAIPERFDGVGRHFLTVDVHPDNGVSSVRLVAVDD